MSEQIENQEVYNREPKRQAELDALLTKENEAKPSIDISKTETTESSPPEISEVERKARELGWKSKEERLAEGKSNDHYVEPDEYVRRKPLFERIESQNKQLRELKEQQRKVAEHLATVRRESYEQALRDLEIKQERAVQDANTDEFRRLKAQQQNVHNSMRNDPIINAQQIPEVIPDVQAFVNENASWYNEQSAENAKMKAAAEAVDNFLTRNAKIDGRQIDVKSHLLAIKDEVKRLFPHRFANLTPEVKIPAVNTVARNTAPVKETKSIDLVSRLSPEQRQLGEFFSKSNPEYTLEMYAKDLQKSGALGK